MPVVRLEHTDDERLSAFCGLTDGQLRDGIGGGRGGGMFVGESRKAIDCALDAGVRPLALLMEEKWLEPTMPVVERVLVAYPDVPVFVATPEQFRAVTGYEITRGALVLFQRPAPLSVEEAVRGARRVAVLEDIVNYTNVGAIFRSAVALGIDAVLLTPSCHDPLYRRAARVSQGTVFQVPWARIGGERDWAVDGVPLLHSLGFKAAALALSDESISVEDPCLAACEKLALVLGTEGEGLSASTIACCDWTVRIPMDHGVDSLNVAAASAVAFWETRVR